MIDRAKWEWFGNAGHFIGGNHCRFHLCTRVGPWCVSTVGQLVWDEGAREISAKSKGIILEGRGDARLYDFLKRHGFETLGCGPEIFESMVFPAGPPCNAKGCGCGQPTDGGEERDMVRYMTAKEATEGHMKLCYRWAKRNHKYTGKY